MRDVKALDNEFNHFLEKFDWAGLDRKSSAGKCSASREISLVAAASIRSLLMKRAGGSVDGVP
ncbi:hypothetical protein RSSM_01403 [Rhodopirellula sallentina SM41]|uniref:Uncharacterized protein n=1 Tax=Rhodopirellula sallentina SM41 TaxID=1263870 RepID=M5U6W6_9BACT|nr:hypothetical protein RSSM_01403 [Rhodopirellula sallentina SM41]